jgi:hypothetical protein
LSKATNSYRNPRNVEPMVLSILDRVYDREVTAGDNEEDHNIIIRQGCGWALVF